MALLDDALTLSARARSIGADRSDIEQRNRLAARVTDLRTAIDTISKLLELRREAIATGVGIGWRPSRLSSAYQALLRASQGGLPTEKHLNTAQSQIARTTTELNKAVEAGWKPWAEEQLNRVPHEKIAVLQGDEQQAAVKDWNQLKRLAAKAPKTNREIVEFVRLRDRIIRALRPVPHLSEDLRDLFQRLDGKPPLTLADLSDSSIAMLREAGFASQVQLSRRIG
jgi:hypothetical protein